MKNCFTCARTHTHKGSDSFDMVVGLLSSTNQPLMEQTNRKHLVHTSHEPFAHTARLQRWGGCGDVLGCLSQSDVAIHNHTHTQTRECVFFSARAVDRQQTLAHPVTVLPSWRLLRLTCPISRSTGETIIWAESILHLLLLLLLPLQAHPRLLEEEEVPFLLEIWGVNGRLADTLAHTHTH